MSAGVLLARPHPDAARIVPEFIQISQMDCGPASLMALMRGFGIPVNFGRLREVCQTTVDGTSISTMDDVANQLGLDTVEQMIPADHLLLSEARALPAIAIISNEIGLPHFVVVWSKIGPWVQIMDPARGRQWLRTGELEKKLYRHTLEVPATDWREWAESDQFTSALIRRLRAHGTSEAEADALCRDAMARPGWRAIAALDAACRMTTSLVRAGALSHGRDATRLLTQLCEWGRAPDTAHHIPGRYWSVWPAEPPEPQTGDADHPDQVLLYSGAVIMHADGRHSHGPAFDDLDEELATTLTDEQPKPLRSLLAVLLREGKAAPLVFLGTLVLAAATIVLEGVLLRGLLELGGLVALPSYRAVAIGAILAFLALVMALRLYVVHRSMVMGRALDIRLRLALLRKIPRLSDRYFHSRLISDMAERCHATHLVRGMPFLAMSFLGSCAELIFVAIGISWLQPEMAIWAFAAAAMSIALPLMSLPIMSEHDLRVRSHQGGMVNYYLDALIGLLPIRVHGAQVAIASEHETRLVDWHRTATTMHKTSTWIEGLLGAAGIGAAVLMISTLTADQGMGEALLLVYWALLIPALGDKAAMPARAFPTMLTVTTRLLEPLGAPSENSVEARSELEFARDQRSGERRATDETERETARPDGVAIAMCDVAVRAGGNTILSGLNVDIAAGEHVAIVGESGAGKSSLVGLLMGWHKAHAGSLATDGQPLTGERLGRLRRTTAWVDPAVQIWNRPLLDNLLYGSETAAKQPIASVLAQAELHEVLERLPEGMQTRLGESGRLLSGGEGQRIRLGRAFMRHDARLVLLDEAFRGLDRTTRRRLMNRARSWWRHATMLFVSHDILDTRDFERVLVLDDGQLVEDGSPADLLADRDSRYSRMVAKDLAISQRQWGPNQWRVLWLENRTLREEALDGERDE